MDVRICVVLLVVGGTFAIKGKGFFCRDPDTGKLHPVNTTWRSTTFCGNYTCKLKIKDLPSAPPLREFKVSDINISDIRVPQLERLPESELNNTDEEKRISSILDSIISNVNEGNSTAKLSEIKNEDKKDRYLNDKEIKIISDMLHSVKKSDLETVVDIYNLAQNIYKELDKKTSENLVEETVNEIQISETTGATHNQEPKTLTTSFTSNPKVAHNKASYWYDPLIISQKVRPIIDLNVEASEIIPSLYPATIDSPVHNSHTSFQNNEKQPYFHTLSDFQRQLSYVHSTPSHPGLKGNSFTQQGTKTSPTLHTSTVQDLSAHTSKKQQILLPFPYYQVHYNTYNVSGYPYQYYYGVSPYHDGYRKEYNRYFGSPIPFLDQVTERSYKPGTLLSALLPKDDSNTRYDKNTPDWKTEPLSGDVIEDIRGNFEKNILFKPLCLRKKIKLDKVGKVFKFEEVNREKRSIYANKTGDEMDDDKFEVYIERTTCQSDVDPGFFRMGNDTAPYPACCPQRISR